MFKTPFFYFSAIIIWGLFESYFSKFIVVLNIMVYQASILIFYLEKHEM